MYSIYSYLIGGESIMPFFDGTGPRGGGPLTGRGMGPCGGFFGFGRRGYGRGYGPRFSGFFGRGRPFTKEDEKEILEEYRDDLKAELDLVEKELQDRQE